MKKQYIIAIIALIGFCACLFMLTHHTKASILAVDGYFVSDSKWDSNFISEKKELKKVNIKLEKVSSDELFYNNLNKLYVGEKNKRNVNVTYPIFTNNGKAIVNIDSKAKLINDQFEFYDAYENATITGGKLYNYSDLDQADYETYLFLQLSNMTYVALDDLQLQTHTNKYVIPLNSIINFQEDYIKYYYYDATGRLIYKLIEGIDLENKITMEKHSFTYKQLLIKLDKITIEKAEEPTDHPTEDKDNAVDDGNSNGSNPNNSEPVKYVKPKVSVENFKANVYSATTTLHISDPAGVIVGGINFQFKIGDKIFVRRAYVSSGKIEVTGLVPDTNFQIIGSYKYYNEEQKKMEVTFFKQEIRTLSFDNLMPIELDFSNGPIYSNKIQINNIKIISDLKSETIKGVSKGVIYLNDEVYSLSSKEIQKLINGKEASYTSPTKLPSNKKVTYEISLLDAFGNSIKIKNNKGVTRTSKNPPTATVKVENSEVNATEVGITLKNSDKVNINSFRYVIYSKNQTIVDEGSLDKSKEYQKITLKSLDPNSTYTIKILGNFNIEDGNGNVLNNVMGEGKFTTLPLSSLGYIRVNSKISNISNNSVELTTAIDTELVSPILLELLDSFSVKIIDSNDNIVYLKKYTGQELETIRAGQEFKDSLSGLISKTEYKVEFESVVELGNTKETISVLSPLKNFQTLKDNATIEIKNRFVNGNIIDFDVSVIDHDNAIEENRVLLEVRDNTDKLIAMESIKVNSDYKRVSYEKLKENTNYTFIYKAESYNIGYDNSTFESDYLLFEETVITEEGIKGDITLTGLVRQIVSKNLFDLSDYSRIRIDGTNSYKDYDLKKNSVQFGAKNGYTSYSYFLPEANGKEITISFYAKYDSESMNMAPVYIGKTFGQRKDFEIKDLNKKDWKKYTYTFKMTSNYVSFVIDEIANVNQKTDVIFKDIQILEGNVSPDNTNKYIEYSEKDSYLGTFNYNLYDSREEITTNDYYIRIYQGGELKDSYKYDLENNKAENIIKNFEFPKNKKFTIKLSVKIRDRYYNIASLDFNSNEEIRVIRTVGEFFAMHPNGKYIVLNDLDFSKNGSVYSPKFYGKIDFQGYTINTNIQGRGSYIFHTIASSGRVDNVVMNYKLDNTSARTWFYGLFYQNYGTIDNLMINVLESVAQPNMVFILGGYANYGTIQNFVINSQAPVYTKNRTGLLVYSNQGSIYNGYVYGENIQAFYESLETRKDVGAIAASTSTNSHIENVFSLISVEKDSSLTSEIGVGNIIGYSGTGILQNIYSVEDSDKNNTNVLTQDPNIGTISGINAKNIFYSSDKNYDSKYSNKMSKLALYDIQFQNNILNDHNGFNVDDFVSLGYYPQVKMHDCMPNQEWIKLPLVTDEDLVDITSVEEVSNDGDSAVVLINLNNPGAEVIKEVKIQDINIVKILEQTNEYGKTKLKVELSVPIKYQSKYYVRSLKIKPKLGAEYERTYDKFERGLDIDLYYPINSLNDWKLITQTASQNYMLKTDLDFKGLTMSNYVVNSTFSGKLNGNGHTIKNINIASNNALFNTVTGTIKNLYVENYNKTNHTSYGGLIYQANTNAVIDNVHMKNVSVAAASHLGGIVGYSNNVTVRNCSVTGFKNITSDLREDIRIGSLIGYATNTLVQNSYAQDVDINISNSMSTYGVGGIVGNLASGTIENVYATGSIQSNSVYVGGIVGLGNAKISNVWSNVNIYTELDYVGGIIGKADSTNISNTLAVGAVYSTYDGLNIHRTVGNPLPTIQNNYAWEHQPFYGYITGDVNSELLLTTEELKDYNTYYDLINFNNQFDYTNIINGALPKLKNYDTGELLPNQKDSLLLETDFNVLDMQVDTTVTSATIRMEINNPNNLKITGVEFDYLDITKSKINTQDGITIIEVTTLPNRYYDSYTLTKIKYSLGEGPDKTYPKAAKVNAKFYKNISKFEDWQQISTTTAENYRLTADIDFSGKNNIRYNVSIGRLEGTDDGHTLKNLTMEPTKAGTSFIKKITTSLRNVNFENFNITTQVSGNFINIIQFNYANVENVNFQNITIDAPKASYVGPIGRHRGIDLKNVSISGNKITGTSYVGGLISHSIVNDTYNVTADNCTIIGSKQYIGGIIAYKDYQNPSRDFSYTATNMQVTGLTDVGGMFGYGGANNALIKDSTITGLAGGNYIGGVSGRAGQYYSRNIEVHNCTILAHGNNYVGGMYGWSYDLENGYVYNTTVTQEGTSYKYVGGIVGYKNGYTHQRVGIRDSSITSNGSGTGGIVGSLMGGGTLYYSYIYNTDVTGVDQVGGTAGYANNGRLYYNITNARVTASSNYVGGVIGYINDVDEENNSYSTIAHNIILENSEVIGKNYIGGFTGYAPKQLANKHFYTGIFVGNISSSIENASIGPITGIDKLLAGTVPRYYVYEQNKINDEQIKDLDTYPNLEKANLITATNLQTQSFYTGKSFSTSYWDYAGLASGFYPKVKNNNGKQMDIKLPVETVNYSLRSLAVPQDYELPNVDVYSSGVNTLNIEFDKVDKYSYFEVYQNDKKVFDKDILKRTYTINYNYKDDIKIVVGGGLSKKEKQYKAIDLIQKVTTFDNKYAYIHNNKLKGNIKKNDKSYIHIFNDKALANNLDVYDIKETKILSTNNSFDISLLGESIPLYKFKINDIEIDTYATYSIVHRKDGSIFYDKQIFVKNGNIELVDGSLFNKKNSIIIDSYANKNYVTVLGDDGKIYNLKTNLNFPSNFKNKNIKYMSNNINSTSSAVIIMDEIGKVTLFDYRTGRILLEEKSDQDISVFKYIKENIDTRQSIIPNNLNSEYNDIQELKKNLEKNPIAMDNGKYVSSKGIEQTENNNIGITNLQSNQYITYYDVTNQKYDIINIESIISSNSSTKTKSIISETDKIYSSTDLIDIYMTESTLKKILGNINFITIIVVILLGIILALILWIKNIKMLRISKEG